MKASELELIIKSPRYYICRRRQSCVSAMRAKRQSAEFREKEALAKAFKCKLESIKDGEQRKQRDVLVSKKR